MHTQTAAQAVPEYSYALNTHSEGWSDDPLPSFVADNELAVGALIGRGVVSRPAAGDFVPDADDIINDMANRAGDEHSEFCDGFPDVSDEARAELEVALDALKAWANKHCGVTFYQVERIESYRVTAEDRAEADQYLAQRARVPA